MKRSVRVAKNTGWLVTAKLSSRVLTALFIILLANYLLPASFGVYNLAISITYLVAVLADLGFDELTVREVSRKPEEDSEILGNVLALRLILSLVTFAVLGLIYFLYLSRFQSRLTLKILLLVGVMLIFEKLSGSFYALFQAHERMQFQSITTIVWRTLFLILGIAGILLGYDLEGILTLLVISYIANFVLSSSFYFIKFERGIALPTPSRWGELMKRSSPFCLFIFISVVYGHVIILLISIFKGDFATGVYGASWKIIIFFGVVPYSFGRALYPVFSRFYNSGKKAIRKAYYHSLRYLLIISLPLTLGLYVIGGDILGMIYKEEYMATVDVFRTIVWILPFLFMNGSLKMVLWGSDRTWETARNLLLSSITLVITGVVLIPPYGVYGAAVAVVLAEIVHFLANYHLVTSFLGTIPLSAVWKPYLSSFFMALLLYTPTFFNLNLNPVLILPFAVVFYFVVLYLLKGLDERDFDILREILPL